MSAPFPSRPPEGSPVPGTQGATHACDIWLRLPRGPLTPLSSRPIPSSAHPGHPPASPESPRRTRVQRLRGLGGTCASPIPDLNLLGHREADRVGGTRTTLDAKTLCHLRSWSAWGLGGASKGSIWVFPRWLKALMVATGPGGLAPSRTPPGALMCQSPPRGASGPRQCVCPAFGPLLNVVPRPRRGPSEKPGSL